MAQYRGFAFPFRRDSRSFPARAEDSALIRDSILQILSTERGERIMRPDFGSDITRFVFANNDEFLEELLTEEIRTSLSKYEPRIIVRAIRTQRDDSEITITIEYIVRATGNQERIEVTQPAPR